MRRIRRTTLGVALALLVACSPAGSGDLGLAPAPDAAPSMSSASEPGPTPAPGPAPEPGSQPAPAPPPAPEPAAGTLAVHVLDVGQGSALLLTHPDATVLVDTGRHDRDDVVPALRSLGITALDLVVVTHPHADHVGQFDVVLGAFPVAEVWWNGSTSTSATFERAVDALLASDAVYEEPRAPATVTLGPLELDVLGPWPGADLGELNDASLALRIRYGAFAVVVTGDAEAAGERRMVAGGADRLRADVLVVGHHGSRTSSTAAFLDAVDPRVAVWSAGASNSYGHPHAEVLAALGARGATVLGTAVDGTVTIVTDGTTYEVRSGR